MVKVLVALAILFGGFPAVANADNPGCPSCNQGGGSIGDGSVFKPYNCNGAMLSSYESGAGTPVDLKTLCPDPEDESEDVELPDID